MKTSSHLLYQLRHFLLQASLLLSFIMLMILLGKQKKSDLDTHAH